METLVKSIIKDFIPTFAGKVNVTEAKVGIKFYIIDFTSISIVPATYNECLGWLGGLPAPCIKCKCGVHC